MDGQGVKAISDLGAEAAASRLKVVEIDGVTYFASQGGALVAVRNRFPSRDTLALGALAGLVDYIKADPDLIFENDGTCLVHIKGVDSVDLLGAARGDAFASRETIATATHAFPGFVFGQWMDRERFNIELQSKFAPVAAWDALIQIIANIVDTNVVEAKDNGYSQSVTAKAGISAAVLEKVTAPNPVVLAPYRSFPEIDPIASSFIFRMRGGGKPVEVALFEADGGRWQIDTVQGIYSDLFKRLSNEIAEKKIVLVR